MRHVSRESFRLIRSIEIEKKDNRNIRLVNYIIRLVNYIIGLVNYIIGLVNYIIGLVNYIIRLVNYIRLMNYTHKRQTIF